MVNFLIENDSGTRRVRATIVYRNENNWQSPPPMLYAQRLRPVISASSSTFPSQLIIALKTINVLWWCTVSGCIILQLYRGMIIVMTNANLQGVDEADMQIENKRDQRYESVQTLLQIYAIVESRRKGIGNISSKMQSRTSLHI